MKTVIASLVFVSNMAFAGVIGTGGVKTVQEKPNFAGSYWWTVICQNGRSEIIAQRLNGYSWFFFSGRAIDSAYDRLSLDEAANKACK